MIATSIQAGTWASLIERSGSILFDHIRIVPGWSDQLIVIIVLK